MGKRRPAAAQDHDLVWGRDDLTCPIPQRVINRMHRHAMLHAWPGDTTLTCPGHSLNTTAITDPGRPVRILYSLDIEYHRSGWFANSDYERCLHLSVSHPRTDRPRLWVPPAHLGVRSVASSDIETPTDDEVRAWARVFWRADASKAWLEPAAPLGDPYRLPNIVHARLYLDQQDNTIIPRGEVYHLRLFADGSSPEKIIDGRAGADVR